MIDPNRTNLRVGFPQIKSGLLERLLALEADIEYYRLPPPGQPTFIYQAGQVPVLLSAPHGAAHTRNGRLKAEDEFTAGLARLVAEQSGAHVLYTRYRSTTDPNYDQYNPYKEFLGQLLKLSSIRFVLDIHGAAPHRDFGVALGTIFGRSCPATYRQLIIHTLAAYGFGMGNANLHRLDRLDLDRTFPGGARQYTVTRYVADQLKIPVAQFEINAHLRTVKGEFTNNSPQIFWGDPTRIKKMIIVLIALVQTIATLTYSPRPLSNLSQSGK